jgi:hypothetical protein
MLLQERNAHRNPKGSRMELNCFVALGDRKGGMGRNANGQKQTSIRIAEPKHGLGDAPMEHQHCRRAGRQRMPSAQSGRPAPH